MHTQTRQNRFQLLIFAIFGAGLLVACGLSQETSDPTPTKSATKIVKTNTPVAPSATRIPVESPSPASPEAVSPSEDPTSLPVPTPTEVPSDQVQRLEDKHASLLTLDEIGALSEDLGIVQWEMTDEFLGESRICRSFFGQSWSASSNYALNCIWIVKSGFTFEEALDWLVAAEVIDPAAIRIESCFKYGDDFALIATLGSNGHSVYDAFLMEGKFLYWASIDVGTPLGYSPESLFEEQGEEIDAYLHEVLTGNSNESE